MCQRVFSSFSSFSSSSIFLNLTIASLSNFSSLLIFFSLTNPLLLSLLPSSPSCLLFFPLPLSSCNLYPHLSAIFSPPPCSLPPTPFHYYPLPPPLLLGQLLDLHRGQGKEIYWRDSHICPDEQEYRDMVRQSECTLLPW